MIIIGRVVAVVVVVVVVWFVGNGTTRDVSTVPPPVQSKQSINLGFPSEVTCNPAACKSHPVSFGKQKRAKSQVK
jgi:hypothetical protein